MANTANDILHPLGQIEHVKANLYVVKSTVITNMTYVAECPSCGQQLTTTPEQKGIMKLRCDNCKAIIGFTVKEQEEDTDTVIISPLDLDTSKGMLEWGGRWRKNRKTLSPGRTTIGRLDKDSPSDVQINDDTVSRQSVVIEMEQQQENGAYRYKLTVLKAKNPVKVDGIELKVGNCIDLNYGNTILLGKTEIKFKECKDK